MAQNPGPNFVDPFTDMDPREQKYRTFISTGKRIGL